MSRARPHRWGPFEDGSLGRRSECSCGAVVYRRPFRTWYVPAGGSFSNAAVLKAPPCTRLPEAAGGRATRGRRGPLNRRSGAPSTPPPAADDTKENK